MQLVCIAGWMAASVGHAAAHQHRYCLEHDAFEEGAVPGAGAQAEETRANDGQERLSRGTAPDGGRDHEACGFLLALQQASSTPDALDAVAVAAPVVAVDTALAIETHACRGAVYLIAPKQSPPR